MNNDYLTSRCGGGLEYLRIRVPEGEETGTRCLGVKLGHPVTGGHKYKDRILQVGGWTQG
jgi:hypothetical protein